MTTLQWILVGLGILVVGGAVAFTGGLYALSRNQPATEELELGVEAGALTPCPESPNCVSTQADSSDATHRVEPIPLDSDGQSSEDVRATIDRAAAWVENREDGELVEQKNNYLRAVFTSDVFGFKDDVEVYVSQADALIHFRSASRVGYGDMGANRKRYEAFREAIAED
jgi:uncharacterized protein (DUF1499 family)